MMLMVRMTVEVVDVVMARLLAGRLLRLRCTLLGQRSDDPNASLKVLLLLVHHLVLHLLQVVRGWMLAMLRGWLSRDVKRSCA